MSTNKGPANFFRREKAAEKTKKVAKKVKTVRYELVEEDNDLIFLEGPYMGRTLREIWPLGQRERDYVTKELYFLNNDQINSIIYSMTYMEI